jgi:nickel transport system ATP-binding protein
MSLLEVKHVTQGYSSFSLFGSAGRRTPVLNDVSISIEPGQCLGLLGSSGAGKSTLGKVILGLEKPQQGEVVFQGENLYKADSAVRRQLRRDLQVVFQDCHSSVNPRMNAEQIIAEPLQNFARLSPQELKRTVGSLLEAVGLSADDMGKRAHQFSGGQLQRISIARAMALKPKLIVLDEAVSSLDVVTQARILELLKRLKQENGLSYLFITHDLKAAFALSDAIVVMEQGRVAARCELPQELAQCEHPSVQRLFDSMLLEQPFERATLGVRRL